MGLKKLLKVIMAVIISAIISTIASFWLFEMDWLFLPFPLFAGLAMVFVQKEKSSCKFVDKLFIGSLLFGFFTLLLIDTKMYLLSADFPFWPFYNPKEYLIFSLVFCFVSFLGGLVGIVIKGFYSIARDYSRRQAAKKFK
ncbi:MAG: hypothetical protein WCX08_03400 [Candidatus Buchananbacteria bacterium]|jgi:hypothetical protein